MMYMAYPLKVDKLLLNEYVVINGIVKGETTDEALERYSNFIPRFVNRLHRYFTQHGHKEDEMIELIVGVLDKYELVYSVSVVKDTLEKMKDFEFKPLRRHEEVQVVDVFRLVKSGKVKDEIYFMLHELVKRQMVTVPLLDDKITVNFTQHEGEVVYELGNTEVFKLLPTFNKLCGEYVEPSSRKVLEISLVEDYHTIHPSIAQATKSHNERGGKVDKSAITRCIGKKRASADNCIWLELEGEITEEYISKLVKFGREVYRKQFTKVNKKKGEWIISQDFIGAVVKETGEVLVQV